MNDWVITAILLMLVVVFIGALMCFVVSVAFPPEDKNKPRGGGFVE